MHHLTILPLRFFLALLGGLPLLLLAGVMLFVWMNPAGTLGGGWLRAGASLVLFEFLLLHSGAFMAAGPLVCSQRWQRLLWFLGFGLVYAGSLIFYVRWTENSYVFWVLIGVVVSRLMALVVFRDKQGTLLIFQRSAIGMIVLLFTALICFVPLPSLGITETLRYEAFGVADDMLKSYPQRTLAWGIAYFLIMGIIELFAGWRLLDWTDEQVEQSWTQLQKKG